jgi:hypothetical protein
MAKKNRGGTAAETETTGNESTVAANPTITIQGLTFAVPTPYAEGHVLNTAEASTLNQVLSENLRNNFAGTVKKAIDAATANGGSLDEAALQAQFAEYSASYEFHGRRAGKAHVDPVTRTAQSLAKGAIMAALKKNKIDAKTLPEGKMDELVAGLLAKDSQFMDEAKRRVDAAKSLAVEGLEGVLPAE